MAHQHNSIVIARAKAALKLTYVADALSMPVHWYYNPFDIIKAFPGGIKKFEAAPRMHPSSLMSLHSTSAGGRGTQNPAAAKEVVGDIYRTDILSKSSRSLAKVSIYLRPFFWNFL